MRMDKQYKISVHIPNRTLTYTVDSYEMLEGGQIKFLDLKFNEIKIFDSRICEIVEKENERRDFN